MRKTIKNGIVSAVAIVAGFAAYQSYDSYGVQDSSLLMQNVEALAQDDHSEPKDGDPNSGNFFYCDRDGSPHICTLYIYTNAEGKIISSSTEENKRLEASGKYQKRVARGLEDRCYKRGHGCNHYPCTEVHYNN